MYVYLFFISKHFERYLPVGKESHLADFFNKLKFIVSTKDEINQ